MSHLLAAFTCQDVPSLGGGFHCGRGGEGGLCREPHAVKMSHLLAAFTCQDVPSLGGGFHCRRGGGACVGSLMSRCPSFHCRCRREGGWGNLSMRPHVSSLLVLSDLSQGAIHRYYKCQRRLLMIANQAEEQKRWKWCVLLRSASFTKG